MRGTCLPVFFAAGLLGACSSSSASPRTTDAGSDAGDAAATDGASRDSSALEARPEASSDDASCDEDACTCGAGCCPGTTGYDYGYPCAHACNCQTPAGFTGNACVDGICGNFYGGECGMQVGFPYPVPCAQGMCALTQFYGLICQ